jgi:NTP pyrophosphatase (non-canonical NTP hydrolase)
MPDADHLHALRDELRAFAEERNWRRFHDPKNLAMALASEAGELLAEYRWVSSEEADLVALDPLRRERVVAEIGDITLLLIGLCDRLGVDLITVARTKLEANRLNYPAEASRDLPERPA